MSLPAMSREIGSALAEEVGQGEVDGCTKGCNSIAMSELGFRKALVGTVWALLCTNKRVNTIAVNIN